MKQKDFRNNLVQFQSLTGMNFKEFDSLSEVFSEVCKKYFSVYTLKGYKRRNVFRFRIDSPFSDYTDMLFFILIYIKNNPLQEYHAAMFGMKQPEVNRWIHLLKGFLHKALRKIKKLPKRSDTTIKEVTKQGETLFIDGTERPVQRSLDQQVQKDHFSGKKNGTKLKTI